MIVVIVRTFIVYIAIFLSMRIMGKRQLGELEPSELGVAILIADLAAHPLQDIGIPLLNGLIPVALLLCFELLTSGLMNKSVRARSILCGKPCMLIVDGKINQKEMHRNRFTIDELSGKLRGRGIVDISTVKYGILETDGTLSTLLYPGENPVTANQMNAPVKDTGHPTIIVNNGKILRENLKITGKNGKWLDNELKSRKIFSHKDVYILSVNSAGQVYCNAKERLAQ